MLRLKLALSLAGLTLFWDARMLDAGRAAA
jgi:hypothetical protein